MTSEYGYWSGHAVVNAAAAYVDGARGAGVNVAVVDSGVDSSHAELRGRVVGGYDFIENGSPTVDGHGHGSHVAGIIAAAKDGTGMHGVAPEATIIPYKMLNASGSGMFSDSIGRDIVFRGRTENAHVFNNSWSIGGDIRLSSDPELRWPTMLAEVRAAAAEGRAFVWAAGNESLANPTQLAALPDRVLDLRPDHTNKRAPWLAVAAVDANGTLANYSNRCGYAAEWCLSAQGTQVLSLGANGTYTLKTGTSMAAPEVSGAIALLKSRFNTLDAGQIAYRLLYTANKTGAYADQSLYGQGLMDLQAAYQPVGGLSLPVSGSTNGSVLADAGVYADSRSADAMRAALAGRQVLMVDNFQRATFLVDGSQLVRAKAAPAAAKVALAKPVREVARGSNGATRFSFFDGPSVPRLGFGSAFLSQTQYGGLSFSMSNGVDGAYSTPMKLAAQHAPEIARFVAGGSMVSGLEETSFGARYDFAGGTSLSSQWVNNESGRRSIVGLERSWDALSLGLTATVRSDREEGVSLTQSGKTPAQSLQITGGWRLADNVSLVGAIGQERQSASESLGEFGVRALQTRNTAVAGARWSFDDGRRLGVAYRLVQTPGAKYQMNLPVSAADDGSIVYERVSLRGASQVERAVALSFEQDMRGGFMALTVQAQPGASAATLTFNRRF